MNISKIFSMIFLTALLLPFNRTETIDKKWLLLAGGVFSTFVGYKMCNKTNVGHAHDEKDQVCYIDPKTKKKICTPIRSENSSTLSLGFFRKVGSLCFFGGLASTAIGAALFLKK